MQRLFPTALSVLLLALTGCDELDDDDAVEIPEGAEILAIGDSIFDWNVDEEASIPHVLGETLGIPTVNAAVGGTLLTGDEEPIPSQYVAGTAWSWVVMDGGGNDLNDRCGCGACDAVMNEIVAPNGSGVLRSFVEERVAEGTKVMFMGYPDLPAGAQFGFDRCDDEIETLSARVADLARDIDGMYFADARDVVSSADVDLFDEDRVHPSIEGSRVMGEFLAQAIQQAQ